MTDAVSPALVADIGGTNTRVALARGRMLVEGSIKRYRNADYPGLETVLRHYLGEAGVEPSAVCVDVAGPVRDGVSNMTNLDWRIDTGTLERATGTSRVALLNDMQAQGHALGALPSDALRRIVAGTGEAPKDATQLVVNIGTGFNAAPILHGRFGRVVPASECGHANLPIRDEAELRLCQFIASAHGFPAIEDVLSGRGLETVYFWLSHEAGTPSEKSSRDIIADADGGSDPRAQEALRLFVRMFGRVTGNLALIHLPFGGIYLVGGVAVALGRYLTDAGFEDAFRDKGRFAGFMANFSVSVVEDDYAALLGSASYLADGLLDI